MVDIKFCRESGCDYYFKGLDDCMVNDENVPKDYLKMCNTANYQVYLIWKENKGEGEKLSQTVISIGEPEPFGQLTVDKEILIYALRYTLNRLDFSPYKVIENIKLNIDKFSIRDLKFMIKEITESGCWETEYDYQQWHGFLDDLKEEIKRRESDES